MSTTTLRLAPLLAALVLALVLPGCARSSVYKVDVAGLSESFDASTPLAVDIASPKGRVIVEAGPWIKHPSVAARAYDSDDQPLTEESWVSAELVSDNGRSVLRVLCGEPAGPGASDPKFIVRVRAPSIQGLRIRQGGGKIEVSNAGGSVDIVNSGEGGPVRVKSKRTIDGPITITTTKGDVTYQVEKDSKGTFAAAAPNGEVRVRTPRGTLTGVEILRGSWKAVWNEGANPATIRSDDGDVYLNLGYYE